MDFGKYPFPVLPTRPLSLPDSWWLVPQPASEEDDALMAVEKAKHAAYLDALKAHAAETDEILNRFKRDALRECGLTSHHKADELFEFALDRGMDAADSHQARLEAVFEILKELGSILGSFSSAQTSQLAARLKAGRGGRFHQRDIDRIFSRMTLQEAKVLEDLVRNIESDAKSAGARAIQRQFPWKSF